jgi:hypothetical protein
MLLLLLLLLMLLLPSSSVYSHLLLTVAVKRYGLHECSHVSLIALHFARHFGNRCCNKARYGQTSRLSLLSAGT